MKKTIIIIPAIVGLLSAGCKKEMTCKGYDPWPSAQAVANWKEYSPHLLDDMNAYNSVASILNYFGTKPSFCHDSIIVQRDGDYVLVCGYLKSWPDYADLGAYLMTDAFLERPIDIERDVFTTIYINNHDESVDTLRKVYIKAKLQAQQLPDNEADKYCCDYSYMFFLDTEDSPIRYEE